MQNRVETRSPGERNGVDDRIRGAGLEARCSASDNLSAPWQIMVAITFWFRSSRLAVLSKNIQAIIDFPVEFIEITIHSNRMSPTEFEILERLCDFHRRADRPIIIRSHDVAPGFDLAWRHRRDVEEIFMPSKLTHFVYLEDDITFLYQNFRYFLDNRTSLSSRGLLPSFLRFETDPETMRFYFADLTQPNLVGECQYIETEDERVFVVPPLPTYCALYILDKELAEEFVESRSFHQSDSLELTEWGQPERAAMGLCLENVSPPYGCRYAIQLDPARGGISRSALIHHSGNDHSRRMIGDGSPFGKIQLSSFFADL